MAVSKTPGFENPGFNCGRPVQICTWVFETCAGYYIRDLGGGGPGPPPILALADRAFALAQWGMIFLKSALEPFPATLANLLEMRDKPLRKQRH